MAATAVRDLIDTAAGRYGRAWTRAQGQIVKLVDTLLKQGRTADEVAVILGNTDFVSLVSDAGMAKELKALQGAYRQVLASKVGRHAISESTLTALQRFTADGILAQAEAFPTLLKQETMKVLLGGGRSSDMVRGIEAALEGAVSRGQAETLAATALSTYSRSVGYEMVKQDDPDALYIYEGPIDDITRDECLEMAAAGELTRAEVEDQFPGAFRDGGGWNCRHEWVPVDAAGDTDVEGASAILAEREEE